MENNTRTQYLEPTEKSISTAFNKIRERHTDTFHVYYKKIPTMEIVAVPVCFSYHGQKIGIHSDSIYARKFPEGIMGDEIEILGLTPIRRMLTNLVNDVKE